MALRISPNDYIGYELKSDELKGYPYTLAGWMRFYQAPGTAGVAGRIFGLSNGTGVGGIWLTVQSVSQFGMAASNDGGAVTVSYINPIATADDWVFVAAVFRGTSNRYVYCRGRTNSSTTARTGTTSAISIGGQSSRYMVQDLAAWNCELHLDDILRLEAGIEPVENVRRDALMFYAPLTEDFSDVARGRRITAVTNSPTIIDDARTGRRRRRHERNLKRFFIPSGGGGGPTTPKTLATLGVGT